MSPGIITCSYLDTSIKSASRWYASFGGSACVRGCVLFRPYYTLLQRLPARARLLAIAPVPNAAFLGPGSPRRRTWWRNAPRRGFNRQRVGWFQVRASPTPCYNTEAYIQRRCLAAPGTAPGLLYCPQV